MDREIEGLLDEIDLILGRVSIHIVENISELKNHLVVIDINTLVPKGQ